MTSARDIERLLSSSRAICRAEAARRIGISTSAIERRVKRKKDPLPAARWEGGDMIIILTDDLEKHFRDFPVQEQKRNTRAKQRGFSLEETEWD